jgi:hypothetical protein
MHNRTTLRSSVGIYLSNETPEIRLSRRAAGDALAERLTIATRLCRAEAIRRVVTEGS